MEDSKQERGKLCSQVQVKTHKKADSSKKEKHLESARHLAVFVIGASLGSSVPLPVMLNNAFQDQEEKNPAAYASRNNAFCTQLVYGYFRHAGLLRFALADFVKKPQSLPQECLIALYLGAYEILFLNDVENFRDNSHAILFEYVEMIKTGFGQKLSGLINGVLRNVQRGKEEILMRLEEVKKTYTAPILSHQIPSKKSIRKMHALADFPDFFSDEIHKDFLQGLVRNSFFAPVPSYRVNAKFKDMLCENLQDIQMTQAETKNSEYTLIENTCLYWAKPKEQSKELVKEIKQWENDGLLTRQGVSSQLVAKKIAEFIQSLPKFRGLENQNTDNTLAQNEFLVWDACCGRGGKSSAVMETGVPVHLCSDPNAERLSYAEENMGRLRLFDTHNSPDVPSSPDCLGTPHTPDSAASPDKPLFCVKSAEEIAEKIGSKESEDFAHRFSSEKFSFIILDSPCSTSGTIARNPEVKHRINPESLEVITKLQAELLNTTWECLQEGGYLMYITCSVFSKENDEQVSRFMEEHNATLVEQNYIIPYAISEEFKGHDILFYALLQKTP